MTISTSANSKNGNSSAEPIGSFSGHPVPAHELHQTRDRIVILMMTLVAAAAAAIFHMHLGYTAFGSAAMGCVVLAGFLALHALKKRTAQIGRLRHDVSRLEQELGRLRPPVPAVAKSGNTIGSGSTLGESASEKATSAPVSNTSQASQGTHVSVGEPGRAPSVSSITSPPQPLPSYAPEMASVTMGPGFSDGAPERISPDARWEAPGFGRASKATPALKTGGIAQGHAPTQNTMKTDRPVGPANVAAPPRSAGRPSAPELFEAPSWSGTAISPSDPLRDAWSFRPKEAVEARSFAADAGEALEPALRMPSPLGNVNNANLQPRGIEADLEMVQRKIKAMAEEVNATEAARLKPPGEFQRPTAAVASNTINMGTGLGHAPVSAEFGTAAMAIEDGISALKNAAGAMRSPAAALAAARDVTQPQALPSMLPPADLLIPSTAQTIAVSTSPVASAPETRSQHSAQSGASYGALQLGEAQPSRVPETRPPENRIPESHVPAPEAKVPEIQDSRVTEIAKAIESKSMDVLLSPIVGLGDYAVTHFEVVVRLRGGDGMQIDRQDEALTLAGNHLLALFDAERLSRTAAVAELLESRGKSGAVLSAATGASMSDAGFLETFARVYESRNAISGQLVLTFSQSDVEAFGSGTWQALSDMHSFGFRFALDHVTHLGMDFEYLAQCGFSFVKLPAQVFLKGLPSDSGFITVNDICRHLARCGLTLVVGSVDDEALLARVFGFGALFGQGQLFGVPRQISLDTPASPQSAAA